MWFLPARHEPIMSTVQWLMLMDQPRFFKRVLCGDTCKPNPGNSAFCHVWAFSDITAREGQKGLRCSVAQHPGGVPHMRGAVTQPWETFPALLLRQLLQWGDWRWAGGGTFHLCFPDGWLRTKAWYWSGIQRGICESSRCYSAKDKLAELFRRKRSELNSLQSAGTNP